MRTTQRVWMQCARATYPEWSTIWAQRGALRQSMSLQVALTPLTRTSPNDGDDFVLKKMRSLKKRPTAQAILSSA